MRKTLLILALFLSSANNADADFTVDMTASEARQIMGKPAAIDLAVGETGMLRRLLLCHQDGKLRILAIEPLGAEASEFGPTYRASREPGGTISIVVEMGSKSTQSVGAHLKEKVSEALSLGCRFFTEAGGNEIVLPVSTINQRSGVREIMDLPN